jgi:hypothetical protein
VGNKLGVGVLGTYRMASSEGGSGLVGLRMSVEADGSTGFRMASLYTYG